MKSNSVLITVLLAIGMMILASCTSLPSQTASTESNPSLSIGHSTWVGYGPFYIAQEKGFFTEEGVDVELIIVEDAKSRFAAMAAGELDGLATLDTMVLYYNPENLFSAVVLMDDSKGGDGVVANADVANVADLAGKQVAYLEGSTSHFYIAYLLQEAGLSLDDIESVNMTAGDAGAAFVSANVDAAVTWEPWLTNGKETDHGGLLTDTSSTPGLIMDALLFSDSVIEEQGDAVQSVVNAYYKAVDFYESDPEEAVEIMAKGVGGWLEDPAEFAATLAGVKLMSQSDNETLFTTQAKDTTEFAIGFWSDLGMIVEEVTFEDVMNESFK